MHDQAATYLISQRAASWSRGPLHLHLRRCRHTNVHVSLWALCTHQEDVLIHSLLLPVGISSDALLAPIRTYGSPRLAFAVLRQVLLELFRAIEILCELFPDKFLELVVLLICNGKEVRRCCSDQYKEEGRGVEVRTNISSPS
mgnify:CR=1 FL=1